MDILVISHFESTSNEGGNSRFRYLAELLEINRDNHVELITSDFTHITKRRREKENAANITLIHEPGYSRNVSFKRLFSHYVMGHNLKTYLNLRKQPDVIYCAVPSLSVAQAAAHYAKDKRVRFIIDVQDIWPEAFRIVFNIPHISDIAFWPMNRMANRVYCQADAVVAVSDTYLKRALQVNKQCKEGLSVYLGTKREEFDRYACKRKRSDKDCIIRLVYIGTLGHSYDLKLVFDAMEILKNCGIDQIQFVVLGSGPLGRAYEEYVKEKKISVLFMGRLAYPEMVKQLTECDIAINPIQHGSAQSIINKVADYALAGLPVISTQECQEYRNIIRTYQCGFNCENGNAKDMADKIKYLLDHKEERLIMGENSRRAGEELFDREKTYQSIIDLILEGN